MGTRPGIGKRGSLGLRLVHMRNRNVSAGENAQKVSMSSSGHDTAAELKRLAQINGAPKWRVNGEAAVRNLGRAGGPIAC